MQQEVTWAGFYNDGTIAGSVTNALTIIKIDKCRGRHLGQDIKATLDKGEYEQRLQVAFATYLGQPCSIMVPVVGRYFRKNGTELDKYGANLASACLPGQ